MPSAFDHHASDYARTWNDDPVARHMREAVHDVLARVLPPRARVLDAGCGVGLDAARLAEAGHRVVALDASPGMVEAARRAHPGLRVEQLPVESVRDLGERFDAALLNFGVINCVDVRGTAAALGRALETGAPLVIVSMPRLAPTWIAAQLLAGHPRRALRRLRSRADVAVGGEPVPTRYLSVRDLVQALAPWFELTERQGLGFALPPPGSRPRPALLAALQALEAPLRGLPGFRDVGDHQVLVFRRVAASPEPRPPHDLRLLILHLTQGCNSHCIACDHRGPAGGEPLDLARLELLAEQARALGCRRLLLTGGEPLLRPDIDDVLERLHGAGMELTLLSNGLLLARHAAVLGRTCREVIVSLDGHDAATYRATRGVNGLEALAHGVEALRAANPALRLTARVTVSQANAGHLLAIAERARAMGLDGVSYLAADTASGDAFARSGPIELPALDTAALRRELAALRPALGPFLLDSPGTLERLWQKLAADQGRRPHRPPRCNAPWTSAVIEPDLSLRPCFFLPAASHVEDGLAPGLARLTPLLDILDLRREDACRRCVCWAHLG